MKSFLNSIIGNEKHLAFEGLRNQRWSVLELDHGQRAP